MLKIYLSESEVFGSICNAIFDLLYEKYRQALKNTHVKKIWETLFTFPDQCGCKLINIHHVPCDAGRSTCDID